MLYFPTAARFTLIGSHSKSHAAGVLSKMLCRYVCMREDCHENFSHQLPGTSFERVCVIFLPFVLARPAPRDGVLRTPSRQRRACPSSANQCILVCCSFASCLLKRLLFMLSCMLPLTLNAAKTGWLETGDMQGTPDEWESDLIDLLSYDCAITGQKRCPGDDISTCPDSKRCLGTMCSLSISLSLSLSLSLSISLSLSVSLSLYLSISLSLSVSLSISLSLSLSLSLSISICVCICVGAPLAKWGCRFRC